MSKKFTLDLWPEYLKYVAAENRKIKRRNSKAFARNREYSENYTREMEKLNAGIERINKRNREKYEEAQRAWDRQPWYKKAFGDDRPWLGYSPIPTHSTISWTFPMLEREKKPSMEDFLTWQARGGIQ